VTKVITDGTCYRLDRNGKLFVAHREAICLGAYSDGVHMSIGMGDNDPTLKPGDRITVKQAFERFARAIATRELQLSQRIKREPTQEQFNALFSCFYQGGNRNVPGLVAMHNSGADPHKVGAEFSALSRCTNKAGLFMAGLQSRRKLEGHLYATGEYEKDLDLVSLYHGNPRDRATKVEQYRVTRLDLP
jgi:GH24 family phage-related lysozyme (muramidase)